MISPFLTLIFKQDNNFAVVTDQKSGGFNAINYFKEKLYLLLQEPGGNVKALLILCVVIFVAIILKNLFSYLSTYFLNPIRNRILNDMRKHMYHKILQLPVGFFSEQRKGDVMSKLSNDLADVEGSTISAVSYTHLDVYKRQGFFRYGYGLVEGDGLLADGRKGQVSRHQLGQRSWFDLVVRSLRSQDLTGTGFKQQPGLGGECRRHWQLLGIGRGSQGKERK